MGPSASIVRYTSVRSNDASLTTCGADCQVLNRKGKAVKKGLKALKEGTEVAVTCEEKDGKQVCSKITVTARKKKDKQ